MLKRTTVAAFAKRKREGEKLVMITAYDAPTAAAAADAGIDILLVGDSLAPRKCRPPGGAGIFCDL